MRLEHVLGQRDGAELAERGPIHAQKLHVQTQQLGHHKPTAAVRTGHTTVLAVVARMVEGVLGFNGDGAVERTSDGAPGAVQHVGVHVAQLTVIAAPQHARHNAVCAVALQVVVHLPRTHLLVAVDALNLPSRARELQVVRQFFRHQPVVSAVVGAQGRAPLARYTVRLLLARNHVHAAPQRALDNVVHAPARDLHLSQEACLELRK
mmetsp:Transcript_22197/g.49376  ORF Transcript_22197/g.49376 Transcript_22197/m.49376 type:complete len:207 (-) Transcript_22197:3671-4291(-)